MSDPYGTDRARQGGPFGQGEGTGEPAHGQQDHGQQPPSPGQGASYGQASPSYGGQAPSYGQPSPSYGQSSAAPGPSTGGYGQASPSYGQPSPSYGSSANSAAPGAYGEPAYAAAGYGGQGGAGGYTQPPKKRGLKRIIAGIVLIVLGGIGAVGGGLLGAFVGAIIALQGAAPSPVVSGAEFQVTPGLYYVAIESSEQSTCTVESSSPDAIDAETQDGDLPFTVDGTDYKAVSSFSATRSTDVTVTCDGDVDPVVMSVSASPIIFGALIGVGIGLLVGVLGIVLLISGIIGRVRSGREQA